jgi:hypothetical protein
MRPQLPPEQLSMMIMGYCFTQAIACAAHLEIADQLASGPRTAVELAELTRCSTAHLRRLMRVLCDIGLFEEKDSRYNLTPAAEYLRKDSEGTLWPLAAFHGDEMYRAFGGLLDNVRSGGAAWEAITGAPVWQHLLEHPDRGAIFDRMMRLNHRHDVQAMVQAYDFSAVRVAVDIGGGDGSLLQEILTTHASLSGILFDTAAVVERARTSAAWRANTARCEFVSGDFFERIPAGGDLYILRHVLHDWDDSQCADLLGRCRQAMTRDARLLVIESMPDAGQDDVWAGISDLGVMVLGGQERTLSEYERLLGQAGYAQMRYIPCTPRFSLLEARLA